MLRESDVLAWLRVCFDPELPVNIVDLGLVNSVRVEEDTDAPGTETRYRVSVELTMRAPNDEREAMLLAQVSNRLAGIPQISRTEVEMSWDKPWTPERMTDDARRQLGLAVGAKEGLVQIRL